MKVNEYQVEIDSEKRNVLVRERTHDYKAGEFITNPCSVFSLMEETVRASKKAEEYLWCVAVTSKCSPIGLFEIGHGCIRQCLVNPREVFTRLCLINASGFFLVHNHPSGDSCPSDEDRTVTRRMIRCANMMGIDMIDHVIVGENNHYSFKERENELWRE